jgi:hypothetical protein
MASLATKESREAIVRSDLSSLGHTREGDGLVGKGVPYQKTLASATESLSARLQEACCALALALDPIQWLPPIAFTGSVHFALMAKGENGGRSSQW